MTHHTCYPFGSECPVCDEEVPTVQGEKWATVWYYASDADRSLQKFVGNIRPSTNGSYIYIGEEGSIPMANIVSIDYKEPKEVQHFVTP